MATYIRLTDYKSSDEKEKEFFNPENRYEAKQEDFSKIPSVPVAYWVSDKIKNLFNRGNKLGEIAKPRQGVKTLDNDYFLKVWYEVNNIKIGYANDSLDAAIESKKKWFPYNKGGSFRKWYGNNEFIVNWENDGAEMKKFAVKQYNSVTRTITNISYFFKEGVTWSDISTSKFANRLVTQGFIFDSTGPTCFIEKNNLIYISALLNTEIANTFLIIINPTHHFSSGSLSKIPVIFPESEDIKRNIEIIAQQNIDISKEEWDSRETSWDFVQNELLRILNDEFSMHSHAEHGNKATLETVYARYCEQWREKFFQLHVNEEELNRLFIDIYELQDELTADVELKDITILKSETKIVEGKLVFQADEIMKQFISYGVGCMFGRYSLDHHGLHVANMNESLDDVNSKFNIENSTFEADADNVIPVLEDDYFKDDMSSRFVQFVKATFGEEHLSQNIRFIEDSLGTTLRKYFVKGFYEDHIKRYKKRPIYWMVASPKKGFMSLIYMHRYEADTFARVRNSYLTEYIAKLEAHKETLALTTTSDTASDKDKKDADKMIKEIEIKLKELIEFDRDKMMSYSQTPTEIDLDDGVKVNYCKFEDILYPITGLCK